MNPSWERKGNYIKNYTYTMTFRVQKIVQSAKDLLNLLVAQHGWAVLKTTRLSAACTEL
jgi:hypothetical protein